MPANIKRCKHELTACRKCGTAEPGLNRSYPPGPPPVDEDHPEFVPARNRADRRAAGALQVAERGKRRRQHAKYVRRALLRRILTAV